MPGSEWEPVRCRAVRTACARAAPPGAELRRRGITLVVRRAAYRTHARALRARRRAGNRARSCVAQAKLIIKPPDQVQRLSDKDLAEEHTRVLKADNPQAPNNLARFSHKEKTYKFDPTVDQTAIALSLEGCAPRAAARATARVRRRAVATRGLSAASPESPRGRWRGAHAPRRSRCARARVRQAHACTSGRPRDRTRSPSPPPSARAHRPRRHAHGPACRPRRPAHRLPARRSPVDQVAAARRVGRPQAAKAGGGDGARGASQRGRAQEGRGHRARR